MHELQRKILDLCDAHDLGKLRLREIGQLIGENHPQKIKHHLTQLEKNGLIIIDSLNKTIKRRVSNLANSANLISLPILGTASCGDATILAEEKIEGYLTVSRNFLRGEKIFAIKASGRSMNKAKINGESVNDGDYVLIDPECSEFKDGDRVLTVIDGFALLKMYKKINDELIGLYPESSDPSYKPTFISIGDNSIIAGRAIGVFPGSSENFSQYDELIYEPIREI